MTPLEAKVVLAERQRRQTEEKQLTDNLWSLFKYTGYAHDRVKVGVLYKVIAAALGDTPMNPTFMRTVRNAVLRSGSQVVFVHGKRSFRGIKML